MSTKQQIKDLALKAGIVITEGNDTTGDIVVHDDRFFEGLLTKGNLALGEHYMDGYWDADNLSDVFYKLLRADIDQDLSVTALLPGYIKETLFNSQSIRRAFQVGEKHYDIGNELYKRMLDPRMVYTCGYWKDVDNLADAQEAKLDLVCRKLGLKPGDRVLDIGCGWGSFMKYAHEKYGVECVGLTVSVEQAKYGNEEFKDLPIEFVVQDYRTYADEQGFDHIVSIGMFEAVGAKNFRIYMEQAKKLLKDDGLFLLHTIGKDKTRRAPDPWIDKYIFPNGLIPSAAEITEAADGVFTIEDWHNFGPYYDPTLMAWFENFDNTWDEIKDQYDERFYRMWKYYLLSCAGLFRARKTSLWQLVLSKKGIVGGYESIR